MAEPAKKPKRVLSEEAKKRKRESESILDGLPLGATSCYWICKPYMYISAHGKAYTATVFTTLVTENCTYQPHGGTVSKCYIVLL